MADRLVHCRECGELIPSKARRCKYCHQKQGKGLKRRSFSGFLLKVIILAYLSYSGYCYFSYGFWPVFGKTVYYETGGWNGYRIYYSNYGFSALHSFDMNDYKPESSASSAKFRKYLDSYAALVDDQYKSVKSTSNKTLKEINSALRSFGIYEIGVYINMIDADKLSTADRVYYDTIIAEINKKIQDMKQD